MAVGLYLLSPSEVGLPCSPDIYTGTDLSTGEPDTTQTLTQDTRLTKMLLAATQPQQVRRLLPLAVPLAPSAPAQAQAPARAPEHSPAQCACPWSSTRTAALHLQSLRLSLLALPPYSLGPGARPRRCRLPHHRREAVPRPTTLTH